MKDKNNNEKLVNDIGSENQKSGTADFNGFKIKDYLPYYPNDLKNAKKLFEKNYIAYYLKKNKGNITQTAKVIGIYRQDLHKKINGLFIFI